MSAEDIDPDSMMGSSPSDSTTEEETDLFPADTNAIANTPNIGRPLTPQNNHLNASAPGELSPPRSESLSHAHAENPQASTGEHGNSMANGFENGNGHSGQVWPGETMGQDLKDESTGDNKPGSGWKSKRAQDDYHRAMESVVDRDFNIRDFGDVLVSPENAKKPSK